jgi:hypothetical protein
MADDNMKDFKTAAASAEGPVRFTIDGEVYEAAPVMPAEALLAVTGLIDNTSQSAQVQGIVAFLDDALLADSSRRLSERMRSKENPISLQEVAEVGRWLIEEVYTGRPTVPPSGSSTGS